MTIARAAASRLVDKTGADLAGRASTKRGPSEEWEDALRSMMRTHGKGLLHLVGVGNPIRQDDAVGIHVARLLRRRLGGSPSPGLRVHGPVSSPELLISKLAARGDRLVVFDAVEANKPPGTIVCANLGDIKFGYFATHNIPFTIIPGVADNPEVGLVVGIQPESLDVTEGLTKAVELACKRIVGAVESLVGGTGDG